MNFALNFPQVSNPDLQYMQAFAFMAFQQTMQQQQQALFQNMFQQRNPFALQALEENAKRILLASQLSRPTNKLPPVKVEEERLSQTNSKKDIRPLVHYLIKNLGTPNGKDFSELQAKYKNDTLLSSLIDILSKRYTTTLKTKEEMVKYTLRKALRWVRAKFSKGTEADPKGGMKIVVKKFFGEELKGQDGFENLDDDEIVDKFLPFKKESKIKTMNTTFVGELFKSREFTKEYNEFLKSFKSTMTTENDRKVDKFINFLEGCYTSGSFDKLKNYKRIPWLDTWVSATMNQAKELPTLGSRLSSKTHESALDELEPKTEYEPISLKKVKIEFLDNSSETNATLPSQLDEEDSTNLKC
mmetsp:Transcript_23921/g.27783  ORF Transcript_23921/g.27783 Transcript_23921/m.27783 type:complete len:357 (-) Transcript_23921:217-1287(-)